MASLKLHCNKLYQPLDLFDSNAFKMFPLNLITRVFATAMKLMDMVEIEEAPSQALLDNISGRGDLMNMASDEVKYLESDLRVELGLLRRLAQYIPDALNDWGHT